jgi:two-component system response regulator GlrR
MKQVLVVDDDLSILLVAKIILERSGFISAVAESGPEALRLLQNQKIDLLLTDMCMPSMSGMELINEALRLQPSLSVCYMTAYIPLINLNPERVPILSKPFARRQLINVVRHVLDAREQGQDQISAPSQAGMAIPENQIQEPHTSAS